jgi:hypothetical protein
MNLLLADLFAGCAKRHTKGVKDAEAAAEIRTVTSLIAVKRKASPAAGSANAFHATKDIWVMKSGKA